MTTSNAPSQTPGPNDAGTSPDTADIEPNIGTTTPNDSTPYCALPEKEKIALLLAASFAAVISPFSTGTYYPSIDVLARDLNVSVSLINLTVSTYQIFQGLAPSVTAAISETYGRRPAYLLCFVVYFGANLGLALQNNYAALLVLRCLQSSGSSGTSALAQGVVSDLATRAERGKYIAYMTIGTYDPTPMPLALSLGNALTPIALQALRWVRFWARWSAGCSLNTWAGVPSSGSCSSCAA